MNFTSRKKTISPDEFDSILDDISKYNNIHKSIGHSTIRGTGFNAFNFTDGERDLTVCYIRKSGSVVTKEATLEQASAVVIYDDNTKIIPSEDITNISNFPELRQAFYEGESFRDREADYKYHFEDGETIIAVNSSNPVSRLDEELTITAVEFIGGNCPQSWILQSENNEYLYLRERSGSIRLLNGLDLNADIIFHAYIGREHPGTYLFKNEVLNIISSVDYINIVDDYNTEVPEEAHEEYWEDTKDLYDLDKSLEI